MCQSEVCSSFMAGSLLVVGPSDGRDGAFAAIGQCRVDAAVGARGLLHLDLDLVEALAVDAVDGSLGDKGVLVDALDDAEDGDRLDLAAVDHEDLDVALGVPSLAVEHRDAAARLRQDAVGDLDPFGREDEELRGLTVGVDDLVGDERDDEGHHDTVDDGGYAGLDALLDSAGEGQEYRARHDEHVGVDHDAADASVAHLRDAGGHDVGAARRAVMYEARADADAAEDRA